MILIRRFVLVLSCFITVQSFSQDVDFQSSNLPIIVIDTEGRIIGNEPKVKARMGIIDNETKQNSLTDPFNDYDGFIGIEYRGSSSQALFPKKSFGFETWDEAENEIDTSLLGFPSEQDWVLHGPYSDKTLMRNKLTFDLYTHTGHYSSRTKYVEVVLNGQYHGLYLLMEKVKRDENRVDIARLREEDNSGDELTGGYIIKLDKYDGSGGDGFSSEYAAPNAQNNHPFFQYDEPKEDEITNPQKGYIQTFMARFERTLNSNTYRDPQLGYYKYVDLQSFVDFFLINEINRNVDGYRLSTFMYKDKDSNGGELHLGPIWDFNLAFGNANYCQGGNTEGWAYKFNEVCPNDTWLVPFWWDKLLADPVFKAQVKLRWYTMREGPWSDEAIEAIINGYSETLEEAQQRNFERWPILGEHVWPNNYVGTTYQEEVNYLKGWIKARIDWLDEQFEAFEGRVTTGIIEEGSGVQVYPNPFSHEVRFNQLKSSPISSVNIFNFNGQLIRTIRAVGQEVTWDGRDDSGQPAKAAIYLFQVMGTDGSVTVGKLLKNTH